MKIKMETTVDSLAFDFDPDEYLDCETDDQMFDCLEQIVLDQTTRGAELIGNTKSELWAMVQEARKKH